MKYRRRRPSRSFKKRRSYSGKRKRRRSYITVSRGGIRL